MKRAWTIYLLALGVIIALGLWSRRIVEGEPSFFSEYAGDTLWALMVYVGIGLLRPRWPIGRVAVAALLFSFGIEISQLYHAPWIDRIRHTTLGGLVLGYGFLWSDLLCYATGITIGMVLERGTIARAGRA